MFSGNSNIFTDSEAGFYTELLVIFAVFETVNGVVFSFVSEVALGRIWSIFGIT